MTTEFPRGSACLSLLAALLVALPVAADPAASPVFGPSGVEWLPLAEDAGEMVLTVSGPGGFYLRQEVAAGEHPALGLFDDSGQPLPEGAYSWELRQAPRLDPETLSALEAVRAADDPAARAELAQRLPRGAVDSGAFRILDGRLVAPGQVEEPPARSGEGPQLGERYVFHSGSGSIDGSLCVGYDCPASPSFSYTTILTMENNTRFKFDDTSTSASYAKNDWWLSANDHLSGGLDRFFIQDCGEASEGSCSGDIPFTIEADARNNALWIDDSNRVGFGTSTPYTELHVLDGDTPNLRLEQTSDFGFARQVWDVAGNETNFFIRDVTSGSLLSLRIRPGAPTSSLDIASDGDVGLGTSSPDASLHVEGSDGDTQLLVEERNATTTGRILLELKNNGGAQFQLTNTDAGVSWKNLINNSGNYAIVDPSDGDTEFLIDGDGNVTIPAGSTYSGSDRHRKRSIVPVDGAAILARLAELPLATWSWQGHRQPVRHLGPMAQDFHALFELGKDETTIAAMDMAGVGLAAVQALAQRLEQELAAKDARIAALEARLAALEGAP